MSAEAHKLMHTKKMASEVFQSSSVALLEGLQDSLPNPQAGFLPVFCYSSIQINLSHFRNLNV